MLSIVRIAKSCLCHRVESSHVYSLRAEEKDLSPAALVAGFTRSLHRVMISLYDTLFGFRKLLDFG